MKYKVTLRNKTYEVEVENGEAMLLDEYEAIAPAPAAPAAPAAAPASPAAPVPAAAPAPAPSAPAAPTASAPVAAGEIIKAPMPGTILGVKVSQGMQVKAGQILVLLEAMKMENEIVSPRDGTIAQICVAQGNTVDTDAPLVVLA